MDFTDRGWGKAEDEFLVIVGPELLSAQVRRGALIVPKGAREVAVPLQAKAKGVTEVRLSVGPRTLSKSLVVGPVPPGVRDPLVLPPSGYKVLRLPILAAPAAADIQVAIAFTKPVPGAIRRPRRTPHGTRHALGN